MTSPDVEKALRNLCDFGPAEWGPDAERDPEESLKKGEEVENLIRLAARFVESLDDQLRTELISRAGLLERQLGPDTPVSEAWQAVRPLLGKRPGKSVRGVPKRASAILCPDGDYVFFPLYMAAALAKANTWLDEHPEPPEHEAFRRWRDELWAVSTEADRQHFWGSHLATLCFAATHPQHPQFDLYDYLHLAFKDRVRVARAIQEAAKDLVPAVGRPPSRLAHHSLDFRSVHWFGQDHTFTASQAACVKVLWEAWEQGHPEVSQLAVLVEVEKASERLVDLFKGHPAWGTMIVRGKTKGAYRLKEPAPSFA
jgi:hypothetical protein